MKKFLFTSFFSLLLTVSCSAHKNQYSKTPHSKTSVKIKKSAKKFDKNQRPSGSGDKFTPIKKYPKEVLNEKNDYFDLDRTMIDGTYSGVYKVGEPYVVEGKNYYPKEYDYYEQMGLASWYGNEFDGRRTSNGEIFYADSYTAAHKTLPLPSVVKVTNMANKKSLILRVNDRGPFTKNRVIDVSDLAAEKLGFKNIGTAKVRVVYLKKETRELHKKLKIND